MKTPAEFIENSLWRRVGPTLGAMLVVATSLTPAFAQTDDSVATPTASEPAPSVSEEATEDKSDADRHPIRDSLDSYVAAFNKGDAKALAGHFTETGELRTPGGMTLAGREQIQKGFETYFAESDRAKLELIGTRIDQIAPSVAIETGVARVVDPEDGPSDTIYEAIHIKTADGWKIDRSRDDETMTATVSNNDQLKEVEWMIGTWVDEGEGAVIRTTSRWTKNGNFIIRSFKVQSESGTDFEGTQVVAWDPYAETIRSWTFDSDGGFAVARWTGQGERWISKSLCVLSDGRRASATNIFDLIDQDTIQYSSIGRQVDGELLPSISPVRIVRESN